MNVGVKIGKLVLSTPIICASGTFGFGEELRGMVDFSNIGAVVTKTVTLHPRQGNPPPRVYDAGCGVINSVGLEGVGVQGVIKEKLPLIRGLDTKFIISCGGFSTSEYKKIVSALNKQKDVFAIEVNLSCPNIKMKKLISQDAKKTYSLVKGLRDLTRKTLIVKITPEVTDIVSIAKAVEDAGSDSVSLINTFLSMAINVDTAYPYIGNNYGGYSGKAIKPMALYKVWKVAQNVKIPVIGGGGIENGRDAIEFLLAGASAVSVGTQNMVDPNCASDIVKTIKSYMSKNKIKNIKGLVGKVKLNKENKKGR